jgi:O-antigen ligase
VPLHFRRLITACCCVAYLLFEEASGHVLKRFLLENVALLRPSSKHVTGGDGDTPLAVSTYITNRNMAVMTLVAWPCLFLVGNAWPYRWRTPLSIAVSGAVALTAIISAHETSMIAIVLSAIVLLIAFRLPRLAAGIVAAGWIAATVLVVPAAKVAFHQAELQSAKWLPNSARHRIVLWAYTAEEVAQHPLIGVGVASTKVLDARRGPKVELAPGTPYEWRSAPHAHNVYLQTWYELGAVGAALLLALGLAIIQQIRRLPTAVAPYALASFSASAVAASFSWGMWQAWFMAALGLAAMLVAVVIAIPPSGQDAIRPEG